jgi:hypothetical protein
MTRAQLLNFAQALNKEGPLFRLIFWEKPGKFESSTKAERLSACLNDPGFGAHVAESHGMERLPLPPLDWPDPIIRAHHWLMNPEAHDPDIALAWELNQPQNRVNRDFLRAMHLCRDGTREQLATRAGLSLPVFNSFGELHFNAQDRLDEPVYLAEICRQAGVDPAIDFNWACADRGPKAIWVAYHTGSSELVRAVYSLIPPPHRSKPIQVLHAEIQNLILYRAAVRLRGGATDKEDNPLLEAALEIIAKRTPANAAQVTREEGPTPALAIQLTLDGVPRPAEVNPAGVQSAPPCEHPCVRAAGPDQA